MAHDPDLVRYQGRSRDLLLDAAWRCAKATLADRAEDDWRIAVGLRGPMFYGASATGGMDGVPVTQIGKWIATEGLLEFFGDEVLPR